MSQTIPCFQCSSPNRSTAQFCTQCGAALAGVRPTTPLQLQAGQRMRGLYTIVRPLGRGGMGTIYLASQTIANQQRQVVIKEMLDYYDPSDPQGKLKAQQRFEAEAGTLATLNFAGIPQIFDYFSQSGHNYIVMQFIEGRNLQEGLTHEDEQGQLITGRTSPPEQVRRWGIQTCKILEKLAQRNVVHLDIKPANLIIDYSGDVWLVDFGTAKAQGTAPSGGQPGRQKSSVYGTMGYAPPEQVNGQAEPRSDVYALAATMYHLLTDDDPRNHPFSFPQLDRLPAGLTAALRPALRAQVSQRVTAARFRQLLEAPQPDSRREFPTVIWLLAVTTLLGLVFLLSLAVWFAQDRVNTNGGAQTATAQAQLTGTAQVGQVALATSNFQQTATTQSLTTGTTQAEQTATAQAQATATTSDQRTIEADEAASDQQTVQAEQTISAEQTAQAEQAATAQAAASATAEVQQTTIDATTTALARREATLDARATGTTQAQRTATAEARQTATVRAPTPGLPQILATLFAPVTPQAEPNRVFGPESGRLIHNYDNSFSYDSAGIASYDFIVETIFFNPYSTLIGPWDYGFLFRQTRVDDEFRLIIRSDRSWELVDRIDIDINSGQVPNLDVDANSSNKIRLISHGNNGILFVNDRFISELDLSDRTETGDIAVATGITNGYQIGGETTAYQDFTIWSISGISGPDSGSLEHDPGDDLIVDHEANVALRNFIVEAAFFNPYSTSTRSWDYGFLFRHEGVNDQFRLLITSDKMWFLQNWIGTENEIASGQIPNLNINAAGSNKIKLFSREDLGLLFVNDEMIAVLDLSARTNSGDIAIATGMNSGHEVAGESTDYQEFTIWSLR